ncbi:MAG: hypothetical protein L7S56_04435 [Candidatus Poseidonia sp.]|nr:hypothetical protein [Poseidonia sp.]
MRTLRTIIMGSMMVIPGLFLGMLVWWLMGKPMDNRALSTIFACNIIPLTSVFLGLYFGWKTGEEYAVKMDE